MPIQHVREAIHADCGPDERSDIRGFIRSRISLRSSGGLRGTLHHANIMSFSGASTRRDRLLFHAAAISSCAEIGYGEITMRLVTAIAASLGIFVMLTSAYAEGLRDCGSIRESGERMACLERNTAALSAELETVTRELRSAVKALNARIAATHATIVRLDNVNITSNSLEHRCLHDNRDGSVSLDSCSSSQGWKVSPR
jgi:hypothetical protein